MKSVSAWRWEPNEEVFSGWCFEDALVLVMIGISAGLPAAFLASEFIRSFLFGLTPTDPETITISMLLMVVVAAVAGYLPARRASRVSPMEAIRYE